MRVEDAAGGVHGAGMLLTDRHVLTCAHVVERARRGGTAVSVRVKGRSDLVYGTRVVDECWKPATPDHRGDVAVLELDSPVPGAPRARLGSTWLVDETVRIFGFPANVDTGQEVRATMVTRDFSGERVQLDAVSEQRVRQGFSGAAAVAGDGKILGMVVSVHDPAAESSWMISVSAIRRYAGSVVDHCLTSHPSSDPQFHQPDPQVARTLDSPVHLALTRRLVPWLNSAGPGGVCAVGGGAAVALVARLVGLTVPQYRLAAPQQAVDEAPSGTLPPVGGVDAAVNAAGKTTERISELIAGSLSLPVGGDPDLTDRLEALGSPVVIVVNAVDTAADPLDLSYRLLEPMALRAPGIGVRLLLGFRGRPPAHLRFAAGADLVAAARPADHPGWPSSGGSASRLERLADLVAEVAAEEEETRQRHDHVAPRILGTPEQRIESATALGIRIGVLRDTSGDATLAHREVRGWFTDELTACERLAEDALTRARGLRGELDALLKRRDRLRGRLAAYRNRAAAQRLLEDLAEPYRRAEDRLRHGLCDLRLAERDVDAYCEAVRRGSDRGTR